MRYIQKKKKKEKRRRNKRQKRMISEVEVLLLHCSLTKMGTVVWTRLVSSGNFHWIRPNSDTCPQSNVSSENLH